MLEMPALLSLSSTESINSVLARCDAMQKEQLQLQFERNNYRQYTEKALAISVYLRQLFERRPEILLTHLEQDTLHKNYDKSYFKHLMENFQPATEEALDEGLRRLRQQEMARFILRMLNQLCDTEQLIFEVSCFADACINKALDWHYQALCQRYGVPIGQDSGQAQQMIVLGMGKLGAYELNLSSDIDLIFCFAEAGYTNGDKPTDNQQFFAKLGQKLIKSLDKITLEGFVFRVDMRLRPYGQSGSLVLNFDAMELYYAEQGREWERYAMIKARFVAGDKTAAAQLLHNLKPFVYRKYTDFSVIQALREMKGLINREVRRQGKENDVKLGAGGIREVEFIAQSYQLIYGGRDEKLQNRSLLAILSHLTDLHLLSQQELTQLKQAYFFLRDTEHVLQSLNDQQTQSLPKDQLSLLRVAYAMGFADIDSFLAQLDAHRHVVREQFEQVIAEPQNENQQELQEWREIWLENSEYFAESLAEKGFLDEECHALVGLKTSSSLTRMQALGRNRLDEFMPNLLHILVNIDNRGAAVSGLVALIESVLRRTSYLVLLNENPRALERLVTVAMASPWIIQQLAKQPVLLDELVNAEELGQVPDVEQLRELLHQQGLRLPVNDQEAHMEMLRYFRLSHHLHIVAAEATGKLPLMKVSDYLTFLAEAILEYTLKLAWSQAVEKYGHPTRQGEACFTPEFLIVAYGKLGGIELSHSSDLDLIFLHNADDEGMTDGEKSVENRLFYTRLGQYIVHILTTKTTLGALYEVDMRLRPSGVSGFLVSSMVAFEQYQHNQAWTWEHQALVRARAVAGDAALMQEFYRIREDVLMKPRDLTKLRQDVVEMRKEMYGHLTPAYARGEEAQIFHLKHSYGGIVDIEFMVQFAVLAFSAQYPSITRFSDNIRILENLGEAALISPQESEEMIDIYRFYRSFLHRLALRQEKSEVPVSQVLTQKNIILALWQKIVLGEENL